MIIAVRSRFKVEKVLRVAILGLWCVWAGFLCLGAVSFFSHFYFPAGSSTSRLQEAVSPIGAGVSQQSIYEAIGTGPLSLCSTRSSIFVPNLAQEILILARNSRPDVKSKEAYLLVGLKSSNQEQIVLNGEHLFLNCETKENGRCSSFYFSNEPTSLWVKPLMLDSSEVLVEVGKQIALEDSSENKEEKTQFVLQDGSKASNAGTSQPGRQDKAYIKSMQCAKWWGPDVFIQKYGGDGYREIKDKHKIEFPLIEAEDREFKQRYVCFVEEGDYLTWEKERWVVVGLDQASASAPLGHIKTISGREVEIEVWDETGFHKMQTKLSPEAHQKLVMKPESVPGAVRLRSGSQVTCVLGKRRVMLREGDWLLKTASHWRILKGVDEIEDFLEHRVKGELLVFDKLEKQENEHERKVYLKGYLFDEMRTQSLPISLPLVQEKKVARLHKKPKEVAKAKPSPESPMKKPVEMTSKIP